MEEKLLEVSPGPLTSELFPITVALPVGEASTGISLKEASGTRVTPRWIASFQAIIGSFLPQSC